VPVWIAERKLLLDHPVCVKFVRRLPQSTSPRHKLNPSQVGSGAAGAQLQSFRFPQFAIRFRTCSTGSFYAAGAQGALGLPVTMNNARHVPVSETAARRVGSTKARRGRPRKNSAQKKNVVPKPAAVEIVADGPVDDERITRARGLLAATLRVWELKHRISE
jgi:hypothetical protein